MESVHVYTWLTVGHLLLFWVCMLLGCMLGAPNTQLGLQRWADLTVWLITLGRWRPGEEESE